jgi:hypothetical protein
MAPKWRAGRGDLLKMGSVRGLSNFLWIPAIVV